MNTVKKESGKVLFKKDYNKIIKRLITDLTPTESIESLNSKFGESNPSFVLKLSTYTRTMAKKEIWKWYTIKMICESEYEILEKILSDNFAKEVDKNKLQDAKIEIQQIEFNNTEPNSIMFQLPVITFYLKVLSYAIDFTGMVEGVETNRKEKVFKFKANSKEEGVDFTIRERIAMLKIFQECGFLEKGKSWYEENEDEKNNRYKIFLSIIMGVPITSFKKKTNPFIEDFWTTTTEEQEKEKRKSFAKIVKVTSDVRSQSELKTRIKAIGAKIKHHTD